MVAHLNHSGLLRLYYDIPGAPWNWPRWKEITGIQHGLFPDEDAKLPPGWTRNMASAIHSYFEAYRALPTEEAKHSFASVTKRENQEDYSGRAMWRSWIIKNWGRWKIQLKIHNAFEDSDCLWHQVMVANQLTSFPKEIPITDAHDRITYSLFGSDGLDDNGKTLYRVRKSVHIFAQAAASNFRRSGLRLIARVQRDELGINAAFQELEKEPPTKARVASLVKMVANWRKDVVIWSSEENLLKLAHMELELADIRKALGGRADDDPFNPPVVKKKATKIKPEAFKTLAKSEDVQEILALFEAHFAPDEQLPELCAPSSIPFAEPVEGADPGVEVEAGMSYDELCTNLMLGEGGLLRLFNDHRHVNRLTPWTTNGARAFEAFQSKKENHHLFKPLSMHWHQVAGAHAIVRKFFTKQRSVTNVLGMLIADDVGLGKSFLAALFACFLIELGMRQKKEALLPPLINKFPFLGTVSKIPNRPTLIVAPGTLQRQWLHELQALLKLHSVDLFCYPSSKSARDRFWAEDSPYNRSKHEHRNRIIIASHSTLLQEYRLLWESNSKVPSKNSDRLPWDHPPERLGAEARKPKTLYGQKYLTLILDEAQVARNYGSTHSAVLLILKQAHARLVLTATPLQTRTEDIAAIGRMVGIPHFSSDKHMEELTQDAAAIRRARAELGSGAMDELEANPVVALQVEASLRMQGEFMDRLIRRKATSLDYNKKPLLVLPTCDVIDVTVQLQEWELEYVDNSIPDEAIERLSQAAALGIATESFWSNERMSVTFPREDMTAPIPRVRSLRQWEGMKTTKIDVAARLTYYLLSSDSAPRPVIKDGQLALHRIDPAKAGPRTRKVLIYQEWAFFLQLLLDVLGVYKVSALAINGSMSYDNRAKVVDRFKTDPSNRVLIFSKVGTDQQWSYADESQAIGRIHRQGQTRPVTAYHILASGTVDYFIASLARGKAIVSEAFLGSAKQKKLVDILAGNDLSFEDDDKEDEGTSKKKEKVNKGKSKKQRVKSRPIVIEEDEGTLSEVGGKASDVDMGGMTSSVSDHESIESFRMGSTRSSLEADDIEDDHPSLPRLRHQASSASDLGYSTQLSSGVEDFDDDVPPLPPPRKKGTPASEYADLPPSPESSPIDYPTSDEEEGEQPAVEEPKKRVRSDSALPPTMHPVPPATKKQKQSQVSAQASQHPAPSASSLPPNRPSKVPSRALPSSSSYIRKGKAPVRPRPSPDDPKFNTDLSFRRPSQKSPFVSHLKLLHPQLLPLGSQQATSQQVSNLHSLRFLLLLLLKAECCQILRFGHMWIEGFLGGELARRCDTDQLKCQDPRHRLTDQLQALRKRPGVMCFRDEALHTLLLQRLPKDKFPS
ncbi:hypothetical protein MD484_g8951, partial [Candolleomyces efflorescens]